MKKFIYLFLVLIFGAAFIISGCAAAPLSIRPLSSFNDSIVENIGTLSAGKINDREEKLVITYSPKVELMLVVASLSDDSSNPRYNQVDSKNIIGTAAREYFKDYKDHDAVKRLKSLKMRGFWYDALTSFAMCYSDPPKMQKVFPYPDGLLSHFMGIMKENELDKLAAALNDFYENTKFDDFLKVHKPEYEKMIARIREESKDKSIVANIEDYYGNKRNGYFIIVSPLMIGGHGGDILYEDGEYNFNVCGPGYNMDGKAIEDLAYHEFGHSFVNVEGKKNKDLVKKYKLLQKDINEKMKSQSYPNWEIALNEHVLRATNARMLEALEGSGMKNVKREVARGFKYVPALYKKLEEYDNNRSKYKNFSQFYPELLTSLDVYMSGDIPDDLNITAGPIINDMFAGEFMLVYGTSGDEELANATKKCAEGVAKFLKTKKMDVKVLKDTDVTEKILKSSSLIIYGNPSVNTLVSKLSPDLPVHFNDGGFAYGGESYEKAAMGVDFIIKNPANGDKLLAFYAGNSPESQLKCHDILNGPTSLVIYDGEEITLEDYL